MCQLLKVFSIGMIVVSIFASMINAAAIQEQSAPQLEPTECASNTECGWAVYNQYSRKIEHFVKNTCECPSGLSCIKADDNVQVSAVVYRCREKPIETSS